MTKWRAIKKVEGLVKDEVRPGTAPILQWIDIDQLVIDDSYQRPLEKGNWNTIRKIALAFNWSKFSPVFVSPIEGGKFAVIDGQHRTHAAAACGFEQVPCQIVPMTHAEQAASFAAVNGNVTKVSVWQIFKAALAAGEEWAITARDIAEEGGCTLMTGNRATLNKKPGQIFGIRMFRDVIQHHDRRHIVTALRVLMRTEGYCDTQDFWNTSFLRPVLEALCHRPEVMAAEGFETRFAEMDLWTFESEIAATNRERQREGIPSLSIGDQLYMKVIDWLDENFPAQAALPKPERAA